MAAGFIIIFHVVGAYPGVSSYKASNYEKAFSPNIQNLQNIQTIRLPKIAQMGYRALAIHTCTCSGSEEQ